MGTKKDLYDEDSGALLISKKQLEVVDIDDMNLDAEFTGIATQIAYWNAKYTEANRAFLLERHEHRLNEARLHLLMREEHKGDTPKPTAGDITAYIHTHPDYKTSHMLYIEAEADSLKLKKYAEAVSAKKDMLQSIGAKLRAEWDGDPATRQQHRGDRADRGRGQ